MATPYGIAGDQVHDIIYFGDDGYNALNMVQFPQMTVTTLISSQDTFPNDPTSGATVPRTPTGIFSVSINIQHTWC